MMAGPMPLSPDILLAMPHKQKHRGAHPKDKKLFANELKPKFRQALADYAYLLTNGYPSSASLKLVGDKFRFTARQRMALLRAACGKTQRQTRLAHEKPATALAGQPVMIDGYNQLITTEVLLSGGPVFIGMDNCFRDIASIHSTYRKVEETVPALQLLGEHLHRLRPKAITWVLDQPISNSGTLKKMMLDMAGEKGWGWEVILAYNPDRHIAENASLCITTDSWILDQEIPWFNLLGRINLQEDFPQAWLLDFSNL